MSGMNAQTGHWIGGLEHLKQSIRDILATPLITRVMRRPYGSRLFDMVDAPLNRRAITAIHAATADALYRYEPRFLLKQITLTAVDAAHVDMTVHGLYLYDNGMNTLSLTVEITR